MTNDNYNFKRFWYSRASQIKLSDDGFLFDPESEYGHIHNPDVVSFESIMSIKCLALLGEPGIGKTCAMQAERQVIDSKIKAEGGETLWLDLRSFGSEDRLVHNLFEHASFISWVNGEYELHLFLDSLDECQLRIDNLATLLIDELKKYPTERLFLRIACRTADWSNSLENEMRELLGEDSVSVYELAPLRRKDIIEASKANIFDSAHFLQEINQKEVVPLAIKPVTLNFLINTYKNTHRIPSTQAELYLQGCKLLCQETNQNRRDSKLTGALTAEQRMAVAARIAAITIFANRYAIWTGLDQGDVPEEDVKIQDFCGGNETTNDDKFVVNEAAIRETLATGLFSSNGPNRLSWAHQTYGEFLASYYLVQNKTTSKQILDLLIYPNDSEKKLIPQLNEVAAWLASMRSDVFSTLLESNPEILLRSDMAIVDVNDKAKLIECLLELYSEEKLPYTDFSIHKQFKKLVHPNLARQIHPYIIDDSKNNIVREVAIEIVEACELHELLDDLVNISLNPLQPIQIRVSAAYAIINIGDNEIKAQLKPLAINEIEEDTNDQLKGCGLQAVWPTHMTAEELFTNIPLPKKEFFFGAYSTFLGYELVQHLGSIDLPIALEWVEKQEPIKSLPYSLRTLIDNIMLKAWEHLEDPHVLEIFSKIVLLRLKSYEEIITSFTDSSFGDTLISDYQKRHEIIKSIVSMINDSEKESHYLVHNKTPLVINEDLPWLIECLQAEEIKENQLVWAQLIFESFDREKYEQVDAIFTACSSSPILNQKFKNLFNPIKLDSPEAQKMKNDYLKRKKNLEKIQNQSIVKPPPSERIAKLLDDFNTGELDAWWRLNLEMTLQPDSTHYGDELEPDLTNLYGWKTADTSTKENIVNAAKVYL
jgi:predicted NACHT family NTPase